jgi:hypothetical protein
VFDCSRFGSPSEYDHGYIHVPCEDGSKHVDEFEPASALLFFSDLLPPAGLTGRRALPPLVLRDLQGGLFPKLSRRDEKKTVAAVRAERAAAAL